MSLKTDARIPMHSTQKKTGIIGFLCIIKSIEELFDSLVLSGKLKYLGMYKMSQDNVEMFFCRIRQRGGFNNNPSAVQFRAAYRQLLVKNDLQSTSIANVIPQDTSILSWLTTAEEKNFTCA